jgi:hypothetical protein
VDNLTEIRIGLMLTMIAVSLVAPFGVAIALQTRRAEQGRPVLTYTQLACIAAGVAIMVIECVAWLGASYRPDELSAETTRLLNDVGWIIIIITWPPYSIWFGAVALAILRDKSEDPAFPRWAGYLSIWVALIMVPGSGMIFFKTGPLAYNGLIALYIPFTAFFTWIVAFTVLGIRAINRQEQPAAIGQAPSQDDKSLVLAMEASK